MEQYINRQIFRRKTCKRNSRLRHIQSARRALAKYKDNKANGESIITYMYATYVSIDTAIPKDTVYICM